MFKQFLTESPSSLDFLSTIANGGKLSYPNSDREFVFKNSEFPHGYNMILEIISKYFIELQKNPNLENEEGFPKKNEIKLLKEKIPIIGPGANLDMLKRIIKNPIPIWDIVGNKIFLIDVNGNTFSAYEKNSKNYAICSAYKNFMTHALSHPELSEEDVPELANRIPKATII